MTVSESSISCRARQTLKVTPQGMGFCLAQLKILWRAPSKKTRNAETVPLLPLAVATTFHQAIHRTLLPQSNHIWVLFEDVLALVRVIDQII